MSSTAVVMMVLICGFIWGGFAWLLIRALRSEGVKRAGGAESAGGKQGR